ncbi:MAG TPA: GNAT family N-acetyltransferase [Geminicoccaceae bacterium]
MAGHTVRPAEPDDARAVAQVQRASWQGAYLGMLPHRVLIAMADAQGPSFWHGVLKRSGGEGAVLVAELDDEVVGFISFGPIRERVPGYSGEFYALYVLPEAQGCGVGTALMACAARTLVRHRSIGAAVWVLEENRLARKFYERLGGIRFGDGKLLRYAGEEFPEVREVAYGWPDLRRARWLVEN